MAQNDQGPLEIEEKCARPCPQCLRPLLEEQEILTCHGCFEELHCLCFSDPIPSPAYNILKDELSSVFIFCPTCKAKLFAHKIFDQTAATDCQSRLDTLETQMSKLISVLSDSASSLQGHKTSSPPQKPHSSFTSKLSKPQPLNGHTRDNRHTPHFRSTGTSSGSGIRPRLKSSRSEDRDFALALSGHDQLKHIKPGSKSPLVQEVKIQSSLCQTKSKVKSPPSETRSFSRPQPYVVPSVSGILSPVDPIVASQALKACCFRKTKNDDAQAEVLK